MKGIIITTAVIALGVSAGLAAPFVIRAVSIDINPVASRAERVVAPVTGDPDGLVGAAEVQPGKRRLATPARVPAPVAAPRPGTNQRYSPPARPVRPTTAVAHRVDCRKYIPESQITVTVPCEKVSNKDQQDDDRKETRKSRRDREGRSTRDTAESDADKGAGIGMCRRYVTRAGVTVLQKMPCHSPATAGAGRVAVADR